MFYLLTVKFVGSDFTAIKSQILVPITGNLDNLFSVVWALNEAKSVKEFTVSCGSSDLLPPAHFGFGSLEKWVMEFSKSKERYV